MQEANFVQEKLLCALRACHFIGEHDLKRSELLLIDAQVTGHFDAHQSWDMMIMGADNRRMCEVTVRIEEDRADLDDVNVWTNAIGDLCAKIKLRVKISWPSYGSRSVSHAMNFSMLLSAATVLASTLEDILREDVMTILVKYDERVAANKARTDAQLKSMIENVLTEKIAGKRKIGVTLKVTENELGALDLKTVVAFCTTHPSDVVISEFMSANSKFKFSMARHPAIGCTFSAEKIA